MDTIRVLVIEPGGEVRVEDVKRGGDGLRELVGGWLECPPVEDTRCSVFINEEGKIIGLEPNAYGTAVWWALAPFMRGQDDLWGTVVIAGGVDANGDTQSIPDDMLAAIVTATRKLIEVLPQ